MRNCRMRTFRGRSTTAASTTKATTMTAWICVGVCLIGLITSAYSGPVYDRPRRMITNGEESAPVISSSNGKSRNETSPNKDICVMEGHTIPRRLVSCPTKPGCRAIQKEGECCPEYQCECERNGKFYENGEKIMEPETPCRVCYCQGGEFTCNNVTCYNRNDCKPRYTPGRCCPEYDNCPPLEIMKSDHNENNSSDNTEEDSEHAGEPTKAELVTTPSTTSSSLTASNSNSNDNPLGIKIKEITKPEEIRITDEKPKFVVKVSTSTSSTTTSTTTPSSTTISSSSMSNDPETTSDESLMSTVTSQSTATSFDQFNNTDDPFQLGSEFEQDLVNNGTDTNKNVREVNEGGFSLNALDDVDDIIEEEGQDQNPKEEQEIAPEDDEHNETRSMFSSTEQSPIEMEGSEHKDIKQVIIVDRHGASKPITVIGSSNLQFGGGSPEEDVESFEYSPSHSSTSTTSSSIIDDQGSGSGSGWGDIYGVSNETTTQSDLDGNDSTKHEIFIGVPGDVQPNEGSAAEEDASPDSLWDDSYNSTTAASVDLSSGEIQSSGENKFVNTTDEVNMKSGDAPHPHGMATEVAPLENDELSNPEYPKLPEDFSIHPEEEQQHQDDHIFMHLSTAAPSVANFADVEERSPGEPHLVPEWERKNGTEKENLEEEELNEGQAISEEELNLVDENHEGELLSSSSSSVEVTTEGKLRKDFGGISLHDDMMSENSTEERRVSPSPKDDVESLKMRQEEGVRTEVDIKAEVEAERESYVGFDSKRTETLGRYMSKEMSLWDLF